MGGGHGNSVGLERLKTFCVDLVIDYRVQRFGEVATAAGGIDLVFETLSGETRDRYCSGLRGVLALYPGYGRCRFSQGRQVRSPRSHLCHGRVGSRRDPCRHGYGCRFGGAGNRVRSRPHRAALSRSPSAGGGRMGNRKAFRWSLSVPNLTVRFHDLLAGPFPATDYLEAPAACSGPQSPQSCAI